MNQINDWHSCPNRKNLCKVTWAICFHNNCPELIHTEDEIGWRCKLESKNQKAPKKRKK